MSAGLFTTRDAGGAERGHLLGRRALAAGDDRAGVAHAAARRRRLAGDEADDRLLEPARDELGGLFLGAAADLADEHDRLGLGVLGEEPQGVDEGRADERVAADADAGGLAEAEQRELVDRLVGERAALRDDPDAARLADVAGDDAGLGLPGRDDAGAVRPDQPRPAPLHERQARIMSSVGMPSVMQTTRSSPASAASITASAAKAGGTKMTLALAPVSTAPATVSKIGQPSCVVPPLPGVTPPTTLVP
jgi:hypothetical protein